MTAPRIYGNASEQMFRLYARLSMVEAERDLAIEQRNELARQCEKAADREVRIVSLLGENGPGAR